MIRDSKDKEFSAVIVHKLDRFSRDRLDYLIYKRELAVNGVALVSTVERIDDSPESIMFESLIQGMSEYYSKNLAREVMKGLKENARNKKHTGGIAPFGYYIDPVTKTVKIDEREAVYVKEIFERTARGDSYGEIADYLNSEGVKTKYGLNFSKSSMYSILHNEKYVGRLIYNKTASKDVLGRRNSHKQKSRDQWIISEDECIRIISDELFEAVSQKTTARKKGGANKAIEKYLLSGKVFCGKCGCSMSGNRRRGGGKKYYTSYSCTSRNSGKGACGNKEIKRDVIEKAVMDYLTDYIFNEHTIDMVISKYENYISEKYSTALSKRKGLENKISELEKKIKRVVEILVSSDSDALLGKLNELEKEKGELLKKLEECSGETIPQVTREELELAIQKARQLFNKGELSETRFLVSQFIDRVTVFEDKIEVRVKTNPVLPTEKPKEPDSVHTLVQKKKPALNAQNFYISVCWER